MHRILTVCTGNICRSPLAEAILGSRLGSDYCVESAGIAAVVGHHATVEAQETASMHSIDISCHVARQLHASMACDFDLLLVMEKVHKDWVTSNIPQARGRTFTLGHWRNIEIPDPFGKPIEEYRNAYTLIDTCSKDWLERI